MDLEALRLRLDTLTEDGALGNLTVIGLGAGAGATTIALGLARAFSQDGQRVLLVDAHGASPRLHEVLETQATPGVRDLLEGTAFSEALVRHLPAEGLQLLPWGEPGRCAPASSPERWREVLDLLRLHADRVLVDAGPADRPASLAVAAASDATALVVECGRSRREAVGAAEERLRRHGVALAGIVLNKRRFVVPELVYRGL